MGVPLYVCGHACITAADVPSPGKSHLLALRQCHAPFHTRCKVPHRTATHAIYIPILRISIIFNDTLCQKIPITSFICINSSNNVPERMERERRKTQKPRCKCVLFDFVVERPFLLQHQITPKRKLPDSDQISA